ncbi:MAG: TIGR03067 domain-containing protein [Planctomycetota bacterium]
MSQSVSRSVVSLTTALFLVACFSPPHANANDGEVVAFDGFDDSLALPWKPVREMKRAVSLTTKPGHLTITTAAGTIGGSPANRRYPLSQNLYLLDNPVEDSEDFVVTTCVTDFRPTEKWQQAGILIYNDDDHYLKTDMEWTGNLAEFKFIREWEQKRLVATDQEAPKSDRVWIRVIKRGKVYERLYSGDGIHFESGGELPWGEGSPVRIGLIAQNGGTDAAPNQASFHFFEVRRLTDAERNDSRRLMRQKLIGKWQVTECRCDGIELEQPSITQFEFTETNLTFADSGIGRKVEYQLDHRFDPYRFTMSYPESYSTTRSKGIYQFDLNSGVLTICLTLAKDQEAPPEFKTTAQDGRLLLKLRRDD